MGSKKKNKLKSKNSALTTQDDPDLGRPTGGSVAGNIITDARFASVHSDPRFQRVPKHKSRVAIDSRFDRLFSDKSFSSSAASLDKRGRPKKQDSRKLLRRYYQMEEGGDKEDDETVEDEEEEDREDVVKRAESSEELEGSESEVDRESDVESESSSTTDTDTDEEGNVESYQEEDVEVQEESIPTVEKETRRLAIVNMDWRHVKAVDLFVLLSSFLPKSGQILSVAVYPSEFGLQCMKEEELRGPVGLFDDGNDGNNEDDDDDEIDSEKLRAYERNRLRYYYAVVECDSSATADYLYDACDGAEFERSSNVLDLRFIPDTMEFKHPPRDVATEAPANYEALNFQTQALQQSRVPLTWDDDEPDRVKTLKRKFDAEQLADLELKEFLASDESESDFDGEGVAEDQPDKKQRKVDRYRALLEGGDGSDEDGEDKNQDMEITFNTGLEDLSKRILEKKDEKSETVWDSYLRKRREKKKARKNRSKNSSDDESDDTDEGGIEQPDDFFVEEPPVKRSKKEIHHKGNKADKEHQDADVEGEASRAELELLLADNNGVDTGIKGYKIKPKKVKGKKGEAPDKDKIPTADYDDPRFSALFTSPLFALDPTDPQFKRSAAYARQVAQKQQKGDRPALVEKDAKQNAANVDLPPGDWHSNIDEVKSDALPSNKDKHELSYLVRSLKMKSKQAQLPSDDRTSRKLDKMQSRRRDRKGKS